MDIIELLKTRGFDITAKTKMVRHISSDHGFDLFDVYRNGQLDVYQSFQGRKVLNCKYIVSFIGIPQEYAIFIGVYEVGEHKTTDEYGFPSNYPYPAIIREAKHHYEIKKCDGYDDLINRIVIKWVNPRAWHQWLAPREVVKTLPTGYVLESTKKALELVIESDIKAYSWTITDNVATKELDRSAFMHRGSGVPKEVKWFFKADSLTVGEKKLINIIYSDTSFQAYIQIEKLGRARLFWNADFEKVIKTEFPQWYDFFSKVKEDDVPVENGPVMRLSYRDEERDVFDAIFIDIERIKNDLDSMNDEEIVTRREGRAIKSFGMRYERDPRLRVAAIKYHGYVCMACKFDFEKRYGDRGKEYIEIHHTKPISSFETEQEINPKTDLIPLCSNCHRMIHRRQDMILSLQDLKKIINNIV